MRKKRNACKIFISIPEGKRPLEDLGIEKHVEECGMDSPDSKQTHHRLLRRQ
jgi:hypothetical protein